ncbi:MAG TPA: VIT domain-containing protein [Gemmatimonadales bacterium]|nr:VIT domain-containing protein [Gemmatimonadales bacterium]
MFCNARNLLRCLLLLPACSRLVSPAPALAQGWIEIDRPGTPARPVGGPVTRTASDVHVTIDGHVARVEVREQFHNDGGWLAEGSYLYPLPGEAVFQNFSLWMGEQEIKGEMLNADQARQVYEEIVRRRKDPALLTLAGHGLARAQVFPIQPGETRKVALRYTQLLTRAGDALRFRYAIGDRGGSATLGFHLVVEHANGFGEPYSPTHRIDSRRTDGRLEITVAPDASGDVELLLPLQGGAIGTSLLTHAPSGEDGYFMLLVAPAAENQATTVPRELTLVVDVSGSMSGDKLEQAKAGLRQALGTLGPADRFRLIAFSSAVREFRPGASPATPEMLHEARRFVDGLSADGGTNIAGALDAALGGPAGGDSLGQAEDDHRLGIVLFITDGVPSIGETAPERVAERAAAQLGRRRIFAVGVGHDVNTYLLDRLATQGRGSVEYVAPEASVETAVSAITTKIRHPALVNLRIESSPVRLTDLAPGRLPDLFFGEELVLLGRYRGRAAGDLIVTGERNGRRERFVARANFQDLRDDNDYIPRLWAARRVGDLTRQIRLEGATPELVAQVRDLGLRYGVLTEYTSYLVQEPQTFADGRRPAPMLREDMVAATGAAGANRQTGRAAFDAAQVSAKLAQAKSLEGVTEAAGRPAAPQGEAGPGSATRALAGRVFIRRGGVWTDAGHRDTVNVTAVTSFSEAYFSLVRALPELVPWLRVGDEVLIAGRRVSIRIGPSGVHGWAAGQLEQLVRDFRGA